MRSVSCSLPNSRIFDGISQTGIPSEIQHIFAIRRVIALIPKFALSHKYRNSRYHTNTEMESLIWIT